MAAPDPSWGSSSVVDRPVRPGGAAVVPSASASAETAIQRMVLVIVPPWLASIVLGALSPGAQWAPSLVWAATLTVAVGYLAYLRATPRRPSLLVVPLAVTAVVLGGASPVGLSLAGYPLVASWLNLVCVVIGALLPRGRFVVVGLATVVATVAALATRQAVAGTPVAVPDLAAIATFSIGDLFLLGLPTGILRSTAGRADAAAADAVAAAGARARAEARKRELRRTARLLHDTVVNTLGAIARWSRADRAAVAERCRADLALLRAAPLGAPRDPAALLDEIRARAEVVGLHLDLTAERLGPGLPAATAEALGGALAEALTNVHKHSGVAVASLSWNADGAGGTVEVRDEGCGFLPEPGTGWRGGAADSIAGRCREAGIDVRLTSRPGRGTRIALRWGAPAPAQTDLQGTPDADGAGVLDPAQPDELRAIAGRSVAAMALVVAVVGAVATLAMPAGLPRASSLAGVGIVVAFGLLARAVGRGSEAGLPGIAYPVLAAVGSWLPGMGQAGCVRTGVWWWGGMVGLIVAMAAILLDGRRAVIATAAAGLVAGMLAATAQVGPGQPACVHEAQALVGLYGAALLGGVAYRRRLTQVWRAWESGVAATRMDLAEVVRADEAERTRRDLLDRARTIAEPVLAGVAEGRLDPGDPQVRERSALAEATLRVLGSLPMADAGGGAQAVTALALAAHARGICVHLNLAMDPVQSATRAALGLEMLSAALASCPDGSTVRITVLQGEDELTAMVLVEPPAAVPGGSPAAAVLPAVAARLEDAGWRTTIVGEQVLAETEWP